MEKFAYVNATNAEQASSLLSGEWGETMVIAGGTDLLGELKEYIETPAKVVNLKTIPGLDEIKADASGLTIGALTTLGEIAAHPTVQKHYTALAEASASVASPLPSRWMVQLAAGQASCSAELPQSPGDLSRLKLRSTASASPKLLQNMQEKKPSRTQNQ